MKVRSVLKFLLGLLFLVVVVSAAAVMLFFSDVPRSVLESTISRKLAADVNIGGFDFDIAGKSMVSDVTVRLPAEKEPLLEVEYLHIGHSGLWQIITGNFDLYSLTIPGGELYLRKDERGRWNVQRLAEAMDTGSEDKEGDNSFAELRELHIQDFTVHFEDKELILSARLDVEGDDARGKGTATLDFTQSLPRESQVRLETQVSGSLKPFNVSFSGRALINKLAYGAAKLYPMSADFEGELDGQEMVFATGPVSLFQTPFSIKGAYEFESRNVKIAADFHKMRVKEVKKYFDFKTDITAELAGRLDAAFNGSDIRKSTLNGTVEARDINIYGVKAGQGSADFKLEDGLIVAENIKITRNGGDIEGILSFRPDQLDLLKLEFNSDHFPLEFAETSIETDMSGTGDMEFDAINKTLRGRAAVSARTRYKGKHVGELSGSFDISDNVVDVRQLTGELLGGDIAGGGKIYLADPFDSTIKADWHKLELEKLEQWLGDIEYESGYCSGTIDVKPSKKNPLEPLVAEVSMELQEGLFDKMAFKDVSMIFEIGPGRILLTDSIIEVLDGEIKMQARLSANEQSRRFYVNSDIKNIDANMLQKAFFPDAEPIAGRIKGDGFIVSSIGFADAGGELKLKMTDLNLFNNAVIFTLYNLLNPSLISSGSDGSGSVDLRLEAGKLYVEDFYYYHKGVQAYGSGYVKNIVGGLESPVQGAAFAALRPFKDINLPGMKTLDRTLFMLQDEMVAVKIEGTLGETQVKTVSLPELKASLRSIFSDSSPE